MTKKIFFSILSVALVVLLSSLVIILGCLYGYFVTVQENQLKDELRLAAYGVELSGQDYLERLTGQDFRYDWDPDYRLTWVASDGTVLFDSVEDAQGMENHGNRAEIREAFSKGESSTVRYSSTLTRRTLYYAKALNNGTVLRISTVQTTALALTLVMFQPILLVGILAVILSAVLADRMAKRIVRPLNTLDLDRPLENNAYEELSPLLSRIHRQRGQIKAQLQELQEKRAEFEQITGHMKEGLILLDRAGKVLSINAAARRIFGAEDACVGQAFLTVDRDHELYLSIQTALEEGHSEIRLKRNDREFQLDISGIESDGILIGAALLAFDVTEQAQAERSRREFTANVSHELKTPLQSILGSAELLKNGMVKTEDISRFSGLIHTEASRLVSLVEDIIHLSRLDEGLELTREPVELLALAENVVSALKDAAEKKQVRIRVTGERAQVNGVFSFLYEMLYNLCDNAVKYNVEGGQVELAVANADNGPAVTVRDTGIGIPAEYQSRVFERFFRVDKSRSKASGGTGLGLSIVKHIAQYHGAKLELHSEVGKGTTISVLFPQN